MAAQQNAPRSLEAQAVYSGDDPLSHHAAPATRASIARMLTAPLPTLVETHADTHTRAHTHTHALQSTHSSPATTSLPSGTPASAASWPARPQSLRPRRAADFSTLFAREPSFDESTGDSTLASLFGDDADRPRPLSRRASGVPEEQGGALGAADARKLAVSMFEMFVRTENYAKVLRTVDDFLANAKVDIAERLTSNEPLNAVWQDEFGRRVRDFLTALVETARGFEPYTMPIVEAPRVFSEAVDASRTGSVRSSNSGGPASHRAHARAATMAAPLTVGHAIDSVPVQHRRLSSIPHTHSARGDLGAPASDDSQRSGMLLRRPSALPERMVAERLRHLSIVADMGGRSPYDYWVSGRRSSVLQPASSSASAGATSRPASFRTSVSSDPRMAPAASASASPSAVARAGPPGGDAVSAHSVEPDPLRLSQQLIRVEAKVLAGAWSHDAPLAAARDIVRASALERGAAAAEHAGVDVIHHTQSLPRSRAQTESRAPSPCIMETSHTASRSAGAERSHVHRRNSRSLSPIVDEAHGHHGIASDDAVQVSETHSVDEPTSSEPFASASAAGARGPDAETAALQSHVKLSGPALLTGTALNGAPPSVQSSMADTRRVSHVSDVSSPPYTDTAASSPAPVDLPPVRRSRSATALVTPPEAIDHLRNHLERYVMTALYSSTYGVAREDIAEDAAAASDIAAIQWLSPEHLHVPTGAANPLVLRTAVQELRQISSRVAPEDQLACLEAVSTVVYKALQQHARLTEGDMAAAGADDFLPAMIYVTLQANPPRVASTIAYIERFRDDQQMTGRSGYCFANLRMAVEYLRHLDPETVGVSQAEFAARCARARAGQLPSWLETAQLFTA